MSENIIERSKMNYIPQTAIIVYAANNDYYLEMHRIDDKGRMLAGAPLTQECITEIASAFSVEQAKLPYGVLPENMLYCDLRIGHERYVWYNPPQKRQMYFIEKLKIESGEYYVPGVIYEVKQGNMNIYAFKGQKPNAKTKLFKAPFFNVTDSNVCLGSAKIDYPVSPSFAGLTDYWEKRFWLTEFSHLGGSQNPTKTNLVSVTKASENGFNENELLPMNRTLKDLLR